MAISDMIEESAIAAIVCNPRLKDNPIIACNDAFVALTGYSRAEVVGRNCRFLAGAGTEDEPKETLREAIRTRRPVLVELLNYRKDGTPFRNAVMIAPVFDRAGEVEFFLGSQMEVPSAPGSRAASARARIAALSKRQQQVLAAMAAGKRNKQIAWELGLAERTVKMHRAAVLRELDVRSPAEAVRIAIEASY